MPHTLHKLIVIHPPGPVHSFAPNHFSLDALSEASSTSSACCGASLTSDKRRTPHPPPMQICRAARSSPPSKVSAQRRIAHSYMRTLIHTNHTYTHSKLYSGGLARSLRTLHSCQPSGRATQWPVQMCVRIPHIQTHTHPHSC